MPNQALINRSKAQAIYMNYVLIEARKYAATLDAPLFDPQGRLLVDIKLTEEQSEEVLSKIKADVYPGIPDITLKQALNKQPTEVTTVSLDIKTFPELREQFEVFLRETLPQKQQQEALLSCRGSIIPLQQEIQFHLGLTRRLYKEIANFQEKDGTLDETLSEAYLETLKKVNILVMEVYKEALSKAIKPDGTLDIIRINESLDKARKTITPVAHAIFRQELQKKNITISSDAESRVKQLAEQKTASPYDVLHVDADSELATWITGSDETAHHRKAGPIVADRAIITHPYENGEVKQNSNPRIQIRVPSIALKKGKDSERVTDVTTKLRHLADTYDLSLCLSSDHGKPKAFVYNLYTAVNGGWLDELRNKQTQSASDILKGAHEYNHQQLSSNREDPVFCFVQNISVNGFGDHLRYGSKRELVEETTLISELALLHTIYDQVPEEQQRKIKAIFDLYKKFLLTEGRNDYFSQSDEGQQAIDLCKAIKTSLQSAHVVQVGEAPPATIGFNAKSCLKQIMAHNGHFGHENAKLVQTLSVFCEDASIGGCKSGNERAQSINGRVAILDAIANKLDTSLTQEESNVKEALKQLSEGGSREEVLSKTTSLKDALDRAYNKRALQAAASLVSLLDQGAAAKLEAKPKPDVWDTNYGEESSSVMSYLKQSEAGKMQAHKGLPASMLGAWKAPPKTWWGRLNVIGRISLTLLVIPIIVVAIVSVSQNKSVKRYKELEQHICHVNTTYDDIERARKGRKQTQVLEKISSLGLVEAKAPPDNTSPHVSGDGTPPLITERKESMDHNGSEASAPDDTPRIG